MSPLELLWFFLVLMKAGLFAVSGMGGLPMLRGDLVPAGLISDARIVEAITIGKLSTGPGGLYVVSIGFYVAGWVGAGVALIACILPPLLVLPLEHWIRPRRQNQRIDGLLRGVALSTSGLSIAVSVLLLLSGVSAGGAGPAGWQVVAAIIGIVLGYDGRLHPALILGLAGLSGLVFAGGA